MRNSSRFKEYVSDHYDFLIAAGVILNPLQCSLTDKEDIVATIGRHYLVVSFNILDIL